MPDTTLTSGRVTWTLANQMTGKTARGANGYVVFESTAVAVLNGGLTWLPSIQTATVTDGAMAAIDLPVNDPDVWNWKVTPHVGVDWPAFHVDVTESGVDLSSAAVVPGKGPTRVVQGTPGASVTGFEDQGDGTLVLVLEDGTRSDPVPFATGPAGPANTITMGTVIKGDQPSASLTGTAPSQRLNLVLPAGEKGEPGNPEDLNDATPTARGLMSAGDKAHLDSTPTRAEVTTVTETAFVEKFSLADNFEGIAPQYVTRLDVRSNNVLQAFGVDSRGRYYATQVYGAGADGNMSVTRCDAGGRAIDESILMQGGHGGPWGFEEVGGDVYMWIWWNAEIDGTTGVLRRWKYTPGVTINRNDSSVQTMPDYISNIPGFVWANVTINQRLDLIAFLIRTEVAGIRYDTVQLRSLSEYKAGTNRVIAQLPAINNNASGAFQGFAVTHEHCYMVRGLGGAWPQTARVEQYQWSDGALLHTKEIGHLAYGGVDSSAKAEPENLFPLWDDAGRLALLFALETGGTAKNIHSIYTLAPKDFQQDTGTGASLQRLYAPLRWINVPLLPGFSYRDGNPLQVAKDAQGMVHIRGGMTNAGFTEATTEFAELPWGYRPEVEARWLGYGTWKASSPLGGWVSAATGRIVKQSDGSVPAMPTDHFSLIMPPFQAEA